MNYSGSDWIKSSMRYPKEMSPLGIKVADLLGELFYGIYHLDLKRLWAVDWSNNSYIEISIGWHSFSTVDYDELTRLVFLAHHMAVRIQIDAATHKYLRLMFHQRCRFGDYAHRHPTLDEAVAAFKETVSVPEYHESIILETSDISS
jgi:hypothetical protein